ncbi:enhancer of split M1 protein [Bactrocera tryoni]|uniref:enhancer of split M1 protein n=1 Tax=Bactrocera tryoni TaxID=59916 RepID=UPI001A979ED2|nr:enhancer of split M1 protein [Bactrocera tryoni]
MLCKKFYIIFATLLAFCYANTITTLADEAPLDADQNQEEQPCPVICPALYAPTCGYDGIGYEQFVNPCMMQVENCARRKERVSLQKPFTQADNDWCSTKLVNNLYEIVSNFADNLNKEECLKPCPMIYDPVCISNGEYRVTVATACQLDIYNCALKGTKLESKLFKILSTRKCELN